MITDAQAYLALIRWDKPMGSYLLLWPTLWALCLAHQGSVPRIYWVVYVVGVFLTRSFGCLINDYLDKDFDIRVSRTQSRPLASGILNDRQVVIFAGLLCLPMVSLLFFLPGMVLVWSIPAMVMILGYPTAKRWCGLPQLCLGLVFAWSIPMAYASAYTWPPSQAWILYGSVVAWVCGYDSLYALQDLADDRRLPIHSAPKTLGAHLIGFVAVCYLVFVVGLTICLWGQINTWVVMGLDIFVGMGLIRQLVLCADLQSSSIESRAKQAFASNHIIGLLVFFVLMMNLISH